MLSQKKFFRFTILVGLLLDIFANVEVSLAQATGDYQSKQTGNWSDASTWQTYDGVAWVNAASAPSSSDGVITLLSGHTITANSAITADQVIVNSGSTFNITGNTFTLENSSGTDLSCTGAMALTNAAITGAGTMVINSGGSFEWSSGGYLAGTGTTAVNSGAIMTCSGGDFYIGETRAVTNNGQWTWTSGSMRYYNDAPVINNFGTFNIYTDADEYINNVSSGTFNNKSTGIINKIGSPNDETSFNNIGTFTNNGTININSSNLRFNINFTNTGSINIAFGAGLHFSTSSTVAAFNTGTSISGAGYLGFEGGTDSLKAGTYTVSNMNITYSNLFVTGTLARGSGTTTSLGYIGSLAGPGTVNFNSGSTFNWTYGYLSEGGIVNVNAGATFNMAGGELYIADTKTVNNYGTCTWTSGLFRFFNGTPVFNNYGTFNISTDADQYNYNTTSGIFNNKAGGIVNKIGSPNEETAFNSISMFNNEGTVNINSSRLRLNVNSINSGTYNVALGANVSFASGGVSVFSSGSLAGAGAVYFDAGTDSVFGSTISVATLGIGNATAVFAGTLSRGNNTITSLTSGSIAGAGTFNFNSGSTFNWNSGFVSGNGIMNINVGATLNMSGPGEYSFTDNRTLNNNGTWNWTNGTFRYYNGAPTVNNFSTLNISTDYDQTNYFGSNGVFNNKATGIINKIGSPTEETSFNNIPMFTNEGTININSGRLRLNINSMQTGDINMAFGAHMGFNNGSALHVFKTGGTYAGAGYLDFENGTDSIYAGSFTVTNMSLSGGTMQDTASITRANGTNTNIYGGNWMGNGNLTLDSGSAFNWGPYGLYAGAGTTTAKSGVTFTIAAIDVSLGNTRTLNNYGELDWTSGTFRFYNDAPVLNNYATFNISTDADQVNYFGSSGILNNKATGVINKTGSSGEETSFNYISAVNNEGTVNVNSGNLSLNVNGTHSGTYNIATGAGLRGNINMPFTGSTFTNNGTVSLSNLSFNGTSLQSWNGSGTTNTVTINNLVEVLLNDYQAINNGLTVNTDGRLTVVKDLFRQ